MSKKQNKKQHGNDSRFGGGVKHWLCMWLSIFFQNQNEHLFSASQKLLKKNSPNFSMKSAFVYIQN